jgi:hypothetical protein
MEEGKCGASLLTFEYCNISTSGVKGGVQRPPPPSEVLTKLSRIPSSMENTMYIRNKLIKNMGSTHLQIEWNP